MLKKQPKFKNKLILLSSIILPYNLYATMPTFSMTEIFAQFEELVTTNMEDASKNWAESVKQTGKTAASDTIKECLNVENLFGPLAELGGGELELPCGAGSMSVNNPLTDIANNLIGEMNGMIQTMSDELIDYIASGAVFTDAYCALKEIDNEKEKTKTTEIDPNLKCSKILTYWNKGIKDSDNNDILLKKDFDNIIKYIGKDISEDKFDGNPNLKPYLIFNKRITSIGSYQQEISLNTIKLKNVLQSSKEPHSNDEIDWQLWKYNQCVNKGIKKYMQCLNVAYYSNSGEKYFLNFPKKEIKDLGTNDTDYLTAESMACLYNRDYFLKRIITNYEEIANHTYTFCPNDSKKETITKDRETCISKLNKTLSLDYHIGIMNCNLISIQNESINIGDKETNLHNKDNGNNNKNDTGGIATPPKKEDYKIGAEAINILLSYIQDLLDEANTKEKNKGETGKNSGKDDAQKATEKQVKVIIKYIEEVKKKNLIKDKITQNLSNDYDYASLFPKNSSYDDNKKNVISKIISDTSIPIPIAYDVKTNIAPKNMLFGTQTIPNMDLIWLSPLNVVDGFNGKGNVFIENPYIKDSSNKKFKLSSKCSSSGCYFSDLGNEDKLFNKVVTSTNKNSESKLTNEKIKSFYNNFNKIMLKKEDNKVMINKFDYSSAAKVLYSNTISYLNLLGGNPSEGGEKMKKTIVNKSNLMAQVMIIDVLDKILKTQVRTVEVIDNLSNDTEIKLNTNDLLIKIINKLDDLIKINKSNISDQSEGL